MACEVHLEIQVKFNKQLKLSWPSPSQLTFEVPSNVKSRESKWTVYCKHRLGSHRKTLLPAFLTLKQPHATEGFAIDFVEVIS